jgi:hypothetical protein
MASKKKTPSKATKAPVKKIDAGLIHSRIIAGVGPHGFALPKKPKIGKVKLSRIEDGTFRLDLLS